jgi:Na+/citrate or Na+/malate symporter
MSSHEGVVSDMTEISPSSEPAAAVRPTPWQRALEFKIGIIPLPVYLILWGLVAAFVLLGKVPSDILMNIAVLALGGFTCAEIGKRLPVMKHIGMAAILATFVPSYLVYAHLLPQPVIGAVTDFTKSSNFLYLFISSIIVGSILGMDRHVLIAGFLKIFVPLALGSVLAGAVGRGGGGGWGGGGGARARTQPYLLLHRRADHGRRRRRGGDPALDRL